MKRGSLVTALVLGAAVFATGCKKEPQKPLAGLFAAGAALMLQTEKGERPLAVGSQLKSSDRVRATGPAVLEYFGGALLFLGEGDKVTVGETVESKLIGTNMKSRVVAEGVLTPIAAPNRIIAARYHSVQFTPNVPGPQKHTQGNYFRAFFTPNGIDKLKQRTANHEGPRRNLPPPPHRARVPHVHADELGEGGPVLTVEDGFVVAETHELATAVLGEDQSFDLGRTARLVLPKGAEALLTLGDGRQVELEGPADIVLR